MRTLQKLFPFMLLAILITSCGDKKNVAEKPAPANSWQAEDVIITYVRTPCFGRCPHFEFTVWGSGKCQYLGKNFVERTGTFTGNVDLNQLDGILQKAKEIGYENFESVYDNKMVTDLPSVSTGLWLTDSLQTVRNRYKGPEELQELYPLLDALIESIEWNKQEDN